MKKLTYSIVTFLLAFLIVTGCTKKNDAISDTKIAASKNPLKASGDTVVQTPPDTAQLVALTGDKITLSPGYYAAGDSVGISFNAVTTNLYCSNGLLKFHNTLNASNNFFIDFLHVQEPLVCHGTGDIPMAAAVHFQSSYLTNGSHPLTVTLNGTTYTGSIVISASTIVFDWNYSSGVVISPKTLTR
ncbi:MAG: hypothetical protein JWQ57_55 [Mucilaginibacter sp.]|nr:hypothetical protein [Mucilaginibacter sp.]